MADIIGIIPDFVYGMIGITLVWGIIISLLLGLIAIVAYVAWHQIAITTAMVYGAWKHKSLKPEYSDSKLIYIKIWFKLIIKENWTSHGGEIHHHGDKFYVINCRGWLPKVY